MSCFLGLGTSMSWFFGSFWSRHFDAVGFWSFNLHVVVLWPWSHTKIHNFITAIKINNFGNTTMKHKIVYTWISERFCIADLLCNSLRKNVEIRSIDLFILTIIDLAFTILIYPRILFNWSYQCIKSRPEIEYFDWP